jgi:two-component system, OmpR family, sensor histidine kinase SenX3
MGSIGWFIAGWLGGLAIAFWWLAKPNKNDEQQATQVEKSPDQLNDFIKSLPGLVIKIGENYNVLFASELAKNFGVVRDGRLQVSELLQAAKNSRLDQKKINLEIQIQQNLGKIQTTIEVWIIPLSNSEVLVFGQDLSLLKRVEAVRRDFVANISHELKTPVGALSLLAEAIDSAGDDVESVKKFASKISVETERLANVIRDIIDLSQVQADAPLTKAQKLSVDKMIAEAIDSVKISADNRNISIVAISAEQISLVGVEKQIVSAIRNLLANAVSYSPDKSQITIGATRKSGVIEITVADQGIGIPIADQSRVFERFFRVDQARSRDTGGSGLGLSIVKHVCENHGGEVSVWSLPGEGSTFTMRFPDRSDQLVEEKVREIL